MSPTPTANHQRVVLRLGTILENYLKGNVCEVFVAPFDVRLPHKSKADKNINTVVQPDLCVVCDPTKIGDKGCIGAPDIVVEILSPSNSKKELKYKYEVYEEAGVKEYWIVFPEQHTCMVYTLVDGSYVPSPLYAEGDIFTSSALPGFALDLKEVFAAIPSRLQEE